MDKDHSQKFSRLGITGFVIAVILALVMVWMIVTNGDSPRDCPPGTVWSEEHQHCH